MTQEANDKSSASPAAAPLDLDTVISDSMRIEGKELPEQDVLFSGHPAAITPISTGVDEGDDPEKSDKNKPASSQDPANPDGAAAGGADHAAGAVKAPAEAKPRFKDQSEAERAYTELQGAFSRSQNALKELQTKQEKGAMAQALAVAQADFDNQLAAISKKETATAIKKINALDPESADYDEQVADIWTSKDLAVARFTRDQIVKIPAQAPAAAEPAVPAQADGGTKTGESGEHPNWVFAKNKAKESGLDPDDPVFLHYGHTADRLDADGKERSLEAMVQEMITHTKAYHAEKLEKYRQEQKQAAEKEARRHQAANLPLGASPAAPRANAPGAPAKPMGIGDALNAAAAERRL